MNGQEFVHLVDAGLSPLEAIEAGTANGPPTLGLRLRDPAYWQKAMTPMSSQSRRTR